MKKLIVGFVLALMLTLPGPLVAKRSSTGTTQSSSYATKTKATKAKKAQKAKKPRKAKKTLKAKKPVKAKKSIKAKKVRAPKGNNR